MHPLSYRSQSELADKAWINEYISDERATKSDIPKDVDLGQLQKACVVARIQVEDAKQHVLRTMDEVKKAEARLSAQEEAHALACQKLEAGYKEFMRIPYRLGGYDHEPQQVADVKIDGPYR